MMEQASDNIVDIRYEQTGAATATNEPGMQKSKDSYFGDEAEEQERKRRFQRDQEKEKLRQEKKEALLQEAMKIDVKKKKKKSLKQKQAKKMPWIKIIYTPMGGQNKRY